MKFRKKRSSSSSNFAECHSVKSGIVVDEKDITTVDERDLSTVTRNVKDKNMHPRRCGSTVTGHSIVSKRIENLDFAISIESVDGIIATSTGRRPAPGQYNVPTMAVISYRQKVSGSKQIVKSNIPSMPLQKSTSSIGNRDRYHASFGYPAGTEIVPEDIEMTLPMTVDNRFMTGYQPKQIDFTLSIMRGGEVLKMGVACVSLNGDELNESKLVQVAAEKIVKTTRLKGMKKKKKHTTAVGARSTSFSKDPSFKYSLQRATLKVVVKSKVRGHKNSATNKYVKVKADSLSPPPITEYISVGPTSGSISVITGAESMELLTKDAGQSSDKTRSKLDYADSLLHPVSTMSLSKSGSTAVNTIDEESEESDSESRSKTDDDDDDASKFHQKECIGFVPFSTDCASVHEESTLYSNSDNSQDSDDDDLSHADSTILDDVSIGTIHFKDVGTGFAGVTLLPSHRDVEVCRRRQRKRLGVVQERVKGVEQGIRRDNDVEHDNESECEL